MRLRTYVVVLISSLFVPVAPAGAAISFVEPLPTPLVAVRNGNGAIGVATGDFNEDGTLDLAVTFIDDLGSGQQGLVVVMLGNGDGTLQTPATLVTLPTNVFARGILAKDFDGDGNLDLVAAIGESRQILFFKGHGDGTFDAPLATSTTHRPHGLQTADLNGDSKLDLVTVNSFDNTVSVFLGNGNGTFQAPTDYSVGSNPQDVAIGDVDGVNRPDLVVARSQAVSVLLNNGSGSFGAAASFNVSADPFLGLYLADFDGDGKLDVAAAGTNCLTGNVGAGGCMVFMKGQGNGSFALPSDQNFTGLDTEPTRRFTENAALDLNGDGKPDVLFVHSVSGGAGMSAVSVGLGRGDGTFQVSYWVGAPPQPVPGANPDFVAGLAAVAADFDRDGVLDLAYATVGKDNTRGGVSILFGDTPGTFDVPRSYQAIYKASMFGPPRRGGVFGDFTGDGKVDLAVVSGATDIFVSSTIIDFFRGNGDGSLSDATTGASWPPSGAQFHHTLRSADLDKNGTLDLVFFHSDQNLGQVASGNGNGTFTFFSTFGFAAGGAQNMVLADFNGDGFPDLAVFESVGCFFPNAVTNIEILLQGAGGTKTFSSKSILPVNGICSGGIALVAADFDKDGEVDLVVPLGNNTNGTNESALFFKGNGDGTFQSSIVVGTGLFSIADYVAADLNHDGNLDLIGIGGGSVYVLLGNGNGTFQPSVAYDAGGFGDPCGVRVADFDGDGNPDIAVACRSLFAGFAVLRGMGDGTFESPVKFAVGSADTAWLDVADVNGDGQPDVVIEHGGANGNGYTVLINNTQPPAVNTPAAIVTGAGALGGPHVRVIDALTGVALVEFFAYTPQFSGGVRVAAADVTGDGVPDVITAAGPGGGPHVKVFDGAALLAGSVVEVWSFFAYDSSFTGGVFVAAGDVNGDGFADIITGADAGGGPHVKVFSGLNLSLLHSFFAYDAAFPGGVRVAVGDVNGDGVPDIITGAGPGGGPHVVAFSGVDVSPIRSFFAYDASFTGGVFVAAGDVNGDGVADIITGADAGGGPHVKVFSGATGADLFSFFAYNPAFLGGVRIAAGDLNGDGRTDIITGAGAGGGPHVEVFDGATGALLTLPGGSFFAYNPAFPGGVFVAGFR